MRIVVALGGNALLKRGQILSAAAQEVAASEVAGLMAAVVAAGHQLIITHGNGPQVGLLALQSAAGPAASSLPLDVLGAETEGWIGYAIELALRNALPQGTAVVTLLTQTLVDPSDKAFSKPSKPIGPVYDEITAKNLAKEHHWAVAPDGDYWRRIVPSPAPVDIVEIDSIKHLIEFGAIVICGGGGGIPVWKNREGRLVGIEAVIDKDATSGLLARQLGADLFIMLTDVAGVYVDYGTKTPRIIASASPAALVARAGEFGAGSMGPKVAAACSFVSATGNRAAIGALTDLSEIIAGKSGTVIAPEAGEMKLAISG